MPAAYLAWVTYKDSQAKDRAYCLAAVAEQLAGAVRDQWQTEASIRRLNDPYPLPIQWMPADLQTTEEWDRLTNLASSGAGWPAVTSVWAKHPAELAGGGNQLADVLESIPTGRLVVLGDPGSGKTVLMVRLVLDLLTRRSHGDPVPVLIPVATWDPVTQHFRAWLISQLLIAYPALAAPTSAGDAHSSLVEALLRAQLITPILDGFDELPYAVQTKAIASMNDALRPGDRLIVTSRTSDYYAATRPTEGAEITISAAAVELLQLDLSDVITYLRQSAGGPRGALRWDAIFSMLKPGEALAEVFSNPLMLGLARTIYNPRPGEEVSSLSDAVYLLHLKTTSEIEGHLLDAFIPAAYRSGAEREQSRRSRYWDATTAEKWLTFLACHLEKVVHEPSFAWWDLRRACPVATEVLSGLIAGLTVVFPLVVAPLLLALPILAHYHSLTSPLSHASTVWLYFSIFPYFWKQILIVSVSSCAAGGLASFLAFVYCGNHRSHDAMTWQPTRWIAPLCKWLLRSAYAATYGVVMFFSIDFIVGWQDRPLPFALELAGVVTVALAAALAAIIPRFRRGTVALVVIGTVTGAPFFLYEYDDVGWVVGLTAGLAAGVAIMVKASEEHYPSRAIRWRLRPSLVTGLLAGLAVGVVSGFATGYVSVAVAFGFVVSLGVVVIVGLERIPGSVESAASPLRVLKRDRSATAIMTAATAAAATLFVGFGTFWARHEFGVWDGPVIEGIIFGVSVGPAVGFAFGFALSGYESAWPQWTIARAFLTIRRKLPRGLMEFLDDAHTRGVLRRVGPTYQFRHIELQHRLSARAAQATTKFNSVL